MEEDDVSDDGGDVFEVDKILDMRTTKKVVEYLVSWKGYGPEEDSWEPASNLGNCTESIKIFLEKRSQEKALQAAGYQKYRSSPNKLDQRTTDKKSEILLEQKQEKETLGGAFNPVSHSTPAAIVSPSVDKFKWSDHGDDHWGEERSDLTGNGRTAGLSKKWFDFSEYYTTQFVRKTWILLLAFGGVILAKLLYDATIVCSSDTVQPR